MTQATGQHLDRPSERRSLILSAIGAIVGLLLAGTALFTAHGTRIAGVPPEDVATVNQTPILLSDYVTQLRSLYDVSLSQATPAQKRKVLDDMIREELYVQRGVELGLQSDVIEVRTALVGAVEEQQAVDGAATQPDAATLRSFYAAHRERYADEGVMTLTDYRAPGLDQARAAVAELRAGRPASALRSTGAVDDGAEFYFAARAHLGDTLFAAARRMASGQVSDPIVTATGVHVLVMRSNAVPQTPPFEQVSDRVLTDYRANEIARLQSGADRFLRKRADIQIARGFE